MEGRQVTDTIEPITTIEELTRLIALDIGANLKAKRVHFGFALLMFSFDGPELTYVSNAERKDMLKALKEFIARNEAGTDDELGRRTRYTDSLEQKR